jgi:hypothetical protein
MRFPVDHHIAAVIRLVGHHYHHGIAFDVIEAEGDGPAEAVLPHVADGPQRRHARLALLQRFPGTVGAAVVHHHNFMRHLAQVQLDVELLDGSLK